MSDSLRDKARQEYAKPGDAVPVVVTGEQAEYRNQRYFQKNMDRLTDVHLSTSQSQANEPSFLEGQAQTMRGETAIYWRGMYIALGALLLLVFKGLLVLAVIGGVIWWFWAAKGSPPDGLAQGYSGCYDTDTQAQPGSLTSVRSRIRLGSELLNILAPEP